MSGFVEQIETFIRQADHLLITTHVDPDGDALGSLLATGLACQQLGKQVTLVNESSIPERFSFLPGIAQICRPQQLSSSYQYVIAVDAADRTRVGSHVRNLYDPQVNLLNIDHHATNDAYGTVNFIDSDASSTAEMLVRWIDQSTNLHWDEALATCLYTGILTDTGGFRYANTTPAVLRQAAYLIEQGAPNSQIADLALETSTLPQLKLLALALANLQTRANGQIAWIDLTSDQINQVGASDEDVGGIVNVARNLAGVEVGVLFREVSPNRLKVSFRSRSQVDVAKLASEFGGGGHARAAGCTIEQLSLQAAQAQVIERIEAELRG